MRRHFEKPNGLTGSMAEAEVFGEVRGAMEFRQWRENKTYMTYEEAMDEVRKRQPFDPSEPEPRFADDLQATIAEEISPEDYKKVKFFTAVGSIMDFLHGTDAFIEIEDGDGETHVVTLDVKTFSTSNVKADVFFTYPQEGLDPKDDEDQWLELVNQVASDVISSLQKQRKRVA